MGCKGGPGGGGGMLKVCVGGVRLGGAFLVVLGGVRRA